MENVFLLKVFAAGLIILIGAIIINGLAGALGLTTWFPFAEMIRETGFIDGLKNQNFFSLVYLFLIYPLLLGFLVFLSLKWLKF